MSDINFGGGDVVDNTESVGGWTADDSGTQLVILTEAYLSESKNGALALNIQTQDKEQNERRYTIYFTNRNKEVFYTDKKTKEKRKLPGYQTVDNLCKAICGKTFMEVNKAAKNKVIDLYDFESRKEIPTEVKTFPAMLKKPVLLGVIKIVKNKFAKGKETNEKVEVNEIHMVFRKEDKRTPKEVEDKVKECKQHDKWVKYWDGRVKDDFKEVEEVEEESSGENPFDDSDSDDADLFGEDSSDDSASTDTDSEEEETEADSEPNVADDEEEDPFA